MLPILLSGEMIYEALDFYYNIRASYALTEIQEIRCRIEKVAGNPICLDKVYQGDLLKQQNRRKAILSTSIVHLLNPRHVTVLM